MLEIEIKNEYMSILSESHPGLTFEEYRDSSLFLLYYQYLCLRYPQRISEGRQITAMVQTAVKGKLQLHTFLRIVEEVSLSLQGVYGRIVLKDFSFIRQISGAMSLEKQKSFARYIRKIIKKLDAVPDKEQLLAMYPDIFEELVRGFAKARKDTAISPAVEALLKLAYARNAKTPARAMMPDFGYGVLFDVISDHMVSDIYGYEETPAFLEIMQVMAHMKDVPDRNLRLYNRKEWDIHLNFLGMFDRINIYMPEGVEPGTLISDMDTGSIMETVSGTTKGEFPLLISAIPLLSEEGCMTAILPAALLYREGRESLARKHIVKELNCLDAVMLLPENIFNTTGQSEVLMVFDSYRDTDDVMFFDLSETEEFTPEFLERIEDAWKERRNLSGFCARVGRDFIEENDYNLNFPRYILKSMKKVQMDAVEKQKRIEEIDREIAEIDAMISMYKSALELG